MHMAPRPASEESPVHHGKKTERYGLGLLMCSRPANVLKEFETQKPLVAEPALSTRPLTYVLFLHRDLQTASKQLLMYSLMNSCPGIGTVLGITNVIHIRPTSTSNSRVPVPLLENHFTEKKDQREQVKKREITLGVTDKKMSPFQNRPVLR